MKKTTNPPLNLKSHHENQTISNKPVTIFKQHLLKANLIFEARNLKLKCFKKPTNSSNEHTGFNKSLKTFVKPKTTKNCDQKALLEKNTALKQIIKPNKLNAKPDKLSAKPDKLSAKPDKLSAKPDKLNPKPNKLNAKLKKSFTGLSDLSKVFNLDHTCCWRTQKERLSLGFGVDEFKILKAPELSKALQGSLNTAHTAFVELAIRNPKPQELFFSSRPRLRSSLRLTFLSMVSEDVTKSLQLFTKLCDQTSRLMMKTLPCNNKSSHNKINLSEVFEHGPTHGCAFSQALTQVDISRVFKRCTKTRGRYTVIRSPFVYKKTREQFGLKSFAVNVNLTLNKSQQVLLNQLLTNTKFPSEVKCVSHT